jgi:hypothetical protein
MPIGPVLLPLNDDAYFQFTLTHHAAPPLMNQVNVLDPLGNAQASFVVPAATVLVGLPISAHHAYVVIDTGAISIDFASNAAPITLVP